MDGTTVPASSTLFPNKTGPAAWCMIPIHPGSSPRESGGGRGLLWRAWVSEQSAPFLERAAGMVMSMGSRTS